MVIRKLSFVGPSSPYLSPLDMPYSTKARSAFGDLTPVETECTGGTAFIAGRLYWKPVCPAAFGMNLFDLWPYFSIMIADAICAESNDI